MNPIAMPNIGSNLLPEQEKSLLSLSKMYFNISQYVQRHLNTLVFPVFFPKLKELWVQDEFKIWLEQYQSSTIFANLQSKPDNLLFVNVFELPSLSFCINENNDLLPFFSCIDVLVQQAEIITYKVLNYAVNEFNDGDFPQIDSGLFNLEAFLNAAFDYNTKSENTKSLDFLRDYCNGNHYAVQYVKKLEKPILNSFSNLENEYKIYQRILQEIYGGLSNNCHILKIQNLTLGDQGWYKKQFSSDNLNLDGHVVLKEYLKLDEKPEGLYFFPDFDQLQKDFPLEEKNQELNDLCNLLVDLIS